MELKLLWKNYGKENVKVKVSTTDYDRSKPTGKCGIFSLFE
jgi:hypothetical protein